MSNVTQQHLDFITEAIKNLAKEKNVQLDEAALAELWRRAKTGFIVLMELPNAQRLEFTEHANLAVKETFEAWLEEREIPIIGPPVTNIANEVIRRRIDGQSYETIATDLQIDGGAEEAERIFYKELVRRRIDGQSYDTIAVDLGIVGGAEEAKEIFYQCFQGFDIQIVRNVLAEYEVCEQVLVYLRVEEELKPSKLVENYREEVFGLLQEYDNRVLAAHNEGRLLQGVQEEWREYKSKGYTVERILNERPRCNLHKAYPDDMVVHVVTNRLQHIVGQIQQQLPNFGG